jgi:hypothetical protein
MNASRLVAELKRRKVFKVGGIYAASAFVILQAVVHRDGS